jgi:hypothetical protein
MVLGVEQTQPMDVAMKTATPPHELAVFFSSKTQGFRHSQRRPPTSPPNFKKPFGGVLLLGNLPKRPPNRDRKVGGLHLIWRSSFWSKRQDFRRFKSSPPSPRPVSPLPHPFLGGDDRLFGRVPEEDRQKNGYTRARTSNGETERRRPSDRMVRASATSLDCGGGNSGGIGTKRH